jgi:hypothetical protein
MPLTYYVALPFVRTEDGSTAGEAKECQSEGEAIRRAEAMSRLPENAGAVVSAPGDCDRPFQLIATRRSD